MVVQQYIHQLNNSELGRTGVHESYVSVPRGIVPSLKFVTEGAKLRLREVEIHTG